MAEPEEVIIEAAHLATTTARSLWASRRPPTAGARLDDVRRRLELLVTTLFPGAPAIGAATPAAPHSLLARLAGRTDRALTGSAVASTDGARLRLPPMLDRVTGEAGATRYRLLALEQAARAARGTPALLPAGDRLLRDLYTLAEAAAVDAALASLLPGLRDELAAERRRAIAERPASRATPKEAEVERLFVALLAADPLAPPPPFEPGETPADSLAWARAMARRVARLPGRYRGAAPVPLWGTIAPPADALPVTGAAVAPAPAHEPPHTHVMRRRPRVREASEDEDDAQPGTWLVRADDPQESVEDPMGLQRPIDQEESPDAAELGDALADLNEARLVRTPEAPREVLASDEPLPRAPAAREIAGAGRVAIVYPEWDWRARRYHTDGAVVREVAGGRADPGWADRVLAERAWLFRRVRRDFERLRPRRETLRRQLDGADLDVDAWVTATADAAAAGAPDGRLYLAERHARRDTAVFLLVDVSASTDSWLSGRRRVIDVEREALLVVSEALAMLGDGHAIYAFRGEGAGRVELLPLKRFAERSEAAVRGRIGGLEPDGYTRVGAAVRHATALLARERARRKLLLLLSDGRPNDVDAYEGRYGLEDTRQAFAEARAQMVHPFCVTVDREAPAYASHVFGRDGHAMLLDPERLPQVLLGMIRRLIGR